MSIRSINAVAAASLALLWVTAAAEDFERRGTLALAPLGTWAVPLKDSEMAELRGGFRGFAFNVAVSGSVENLRTGPDTGPTGMGGSLQNLELVDNRVDLQMAVGEFGGFNGVFQLSNVEGSYNVVNNNMQVQVFLVNGGSPELASIMDTLTSTFGSP